MAEISTIARPYAVAAFNLAKEKKALKEWSEMLKFLAQVSQDERMHTFINDSKVSDEEREKSLIKIAAKRLNEYGENLIKLLIEYKRVNLLPEISLAFEALKATDEGTLEAEIIVASKPTDKEVDSLVKSLEKKFNKKIDAKVTIDEAIIGGTKVIVGDTVIDASVREQLQNLAYALKA
ncbi:MAG: F0F1 ATP synthase subunit delta [Betaproteobacteria bacterium]|jgi:F-type H+-transporting ATPase subunit delta|nr:F0F1 ATP synthase subunit delta [Betaproteobacteria bacterium]